MLGWLFAWLLRTNCGQKTTIWPILVAFNAIKMAIYWIITLEKMNTCQPKMDRSKLIKLSSKNSVFDLLKFFVDRIRQSSQFLVHSKHSKWQFTAFWPCIKRIHFSRKQTEVYRWNFLWIIFHMFPGFSNLITCLRTENNNLISFWCIQGGILMHSNPAKHDRISAKIDRGKLIKLCWDDCLLDFYEPIWPILVAFNALKMAIYWIITLEKMNTFQPKMDRGKLIKLSSKNSVFDLLKFFLWTENNNLTSFWCIQSIQSGNLLHSNPA